MSLSNMKLSLFVWKNKEKTEDKQPDYKISMATDKGFMSCGGGWIKSTKTGDKYISLLIDTEPTPWTKPETLNTEEENEKIRAIKAQASKPLEDNKDSIPW